MACDSPLCLRLEHGADLRSLLERAGLARGPVLVVVGGAAGLGSRDDERLSALFRDHVVPAVVRCGAIVVDGGTAAGVMRAIGAARAARGARFPLVGVAAAGTVTAPGDPPARGDSAEIDPDHSHVVLVPGDVWGDESPWLSEVAQALSLGHGSATLLVNGGDISYDDVKHSLDAGRPVVVVAGSGRTADAIASAVEGSGVDERARRVATSPLIRVLSLDGPERVAAAIVTLLTVPPPNG